MHVTFHAHAPAEFRFDTSDEADQFQKLQERSLIRAGLLTYLTRLQDLTTARCPGELIPALPKHLHQPTRALVAVASDGIAIRFEHAELHNDCVLFPAEGGLRDIVPRMTNGMVVIANQDGTVSDPPVAAPTLGIDVRTPDGQVVHQLVDATPYRLIVQHFPKPATAATALPGAELIQNQFLFEFSGSISLSQAHPDHQGRNFTARAKTKPAGFWESISIYQWADKDVWRQSDFGSWAESHFFQLAFEPASTEHSWLSRASQARLRHYYAKVLEGLDALLLEQDVKEEDLQQYLLSYPEILVPGYKRVMPTVPFGAYVSDFVIEDATGRYLLVELENPCQELFVRSGHRSSKLTHAIGQIEDWIRYIQDNKSTVERELGLSGISAEPDSLVVIGRSKSVSKENRRKLNVNRTNMEVLTFDDLRDRFARTVENLIGMLAGTAEIAL